MVSDIFIILSVSKLIINYLNYHDIIKILNQYNIQIRTEIITSIKQQLGEVEKFVNWYSKLKTENGVTKDDYYKRTHKSLHKIKERLMNLSEKIRTL